MKSRMLAMTALAVCAATLLATAQRRVTPVNTAATVTQHVKEETASDTARLPRNVVEMTDSRGRTFMVDTITGNEYVDSAALAASIPKMQYPLLHSASVSVDIFNPAMIAFGQSYGLIGFQVDVNLHNRYIPALEFGLGRANYAPDDNNYVYKSPIAPFFKIGADYNFFYNSDPRYLIFAGVRYGLSPFSFSVTDITQSPGYWDNPAHFELPSQSVTVGYFDALLGLRVNIYKWLSLGWSIRYHDILHESDTPYGQPWYIPGFGSRESLFSATFSVTYTLDFHKQQPSKAVENEK